jgi:hypothetical protein
MSSRNAGSGTHDLSAVWHVCGTNCAPRLRPIKIEGGGTCSDLAFCDGAGEGNRTLMTSLEGVPALPVEAAELAVSVAPSDPD